MSRATAYKWPVATTPKAGLGRPSDPRGRITAPCLAGQPGPSGVGHPAAPPSDPHRLGDHLAMPRSTVYPCKGSEVDLVRAICQQPHLVSPRVARAR